MLSNLDIWAVQLRDSILQQVHAALDAYERASRENVSVLFAQEGESRSSSARFQEDRFTSVMETTGVRLEKLEAFSRDAKAFFDQAAAQEAERASAHGRSTTADADLQARLDAAQARLEEAQERLAALEARPSPLPEAQQRSVDAALEARLSLLEQRSSTLEVRSARAPETPPPRSSEGMVTAAAHAATTNSFERAVQENASEILTLQGELLVLQTRTQMQGVSSSIFSLRAVDMDTRSRAKSLDILVKRESEVKRLMDVAQQAKDRGGMAELLTQLGVRVARSATGEPQARNFNERTAILSGGGGGNGLSLSPSETMAQPSSKATKRAESVGRV